MRAHAHLWLTSVSLIYLSITDSMPHNSHYYSFTLCLDMCLENTLNLSFFVIFFLAVYAHVLLHRNTKEREKKFSHSRLVSYMWSNHIVCLGIGECSSFTVGPISDYYVISFCVLSLSCVRLYVSLLFTRRTEFHMVPILIALYFISILSVMLNFQYSYLNIFFEKRSRAYHYLPPSFPFSPSPWSCHLSPTHL